MLNVVYISLFAYLVGSIPFSLIFAKIFTGVDVRAGGSGNVGATNVLVTTGKKRAALTAVFFDIAKGFSVVVFARIIFGSDTYAYFAGFFAIVGHDFPVYLNFKGGKGIATTVGSIIALSPYAIWFVLIAYIVSLLVTRYFILSSLVALAALPVIMWMLGEGYLGIVFGVFTFVLAIVVHKKDIDRLLSGNEKKIGA